MKRTTIFLPEEMERQLRDVARRSRRPQAEVLREAVAEYLSRLDRPRPRSVGMGESADDSVNSENVKDWVHENWSSRHDRTGESQASPRAC